MSENEIQKPLVVKTDEGLSELTDAGREAVAPFVTDTDAQVYGFTSEADSLMVAAAMARLSRNSNGARVILASEFIGKEDKDSALLKRVVTEFGDDSVMQLYPVQLVFEDISNIATKAVERGRLAAYLEQSSRYLRFDQKDGNGNYRYLVPEELDAQTKEEYQVNMDEIFDIYSNLYVQVRTHIEEASIEQVHDAAWRNACHAQACDSIRGILPSATKATVGFEGSAQALYNLILKLESEPLPELQKLGRAALAAVRQIAPVFFERADVPERGQLISDNRRQTRSDSRELTSKLVEQFGDNVEQQTGTYVKLISSEGNENQLIAKILSDSSQLSYVQIEPIVAGLTDEEKQEVIDVYVGDRYNRRVKPGRAFEYPHYEFEIQCDYGAFRDIQRGRMVDGFEWQPLQPYLGHGRPTIIDQAGLAESYEKAFQISQDTYELLKERGYDDQAQYATLFGHNMRFTHKINARSLVHSAELRTTPQGHPSYRKVFQDMVRLVEEVHPHITRVMRFMNQSENPELARLGAERARQQRDAQ
jgi:thymidylate synthase ThyX